MAVVFRERPEQTFLFIIRDVLTDLFECSSFAAISSAAFTLGCGTASDAFDEAAPHKFFGARNGGIDRICFTCCHGRPPLRSPSP